MQQEPVRQVPVRQESVRQVPVRQEPVQLICLPSFLVGSGPQQFARIAAALPVARTVRALWLPGFRGGDGLPGDSERLVEVLAESIAQAAGGRAFVLVGYSSGGVLAHAAARRLEADGVEVGGVVLLDTYRHDRPDVLLSALDYLLRRDDGLVPIDDRQLLAMGAYLDRFGGAPDDEPLKAPTVLMTVGEPLGADAWLPVGERREITGGHFSLVEQDAAATARAVHDWLTTVDAAPGGRA